MFKIRPAGTNWNYYRDKAKYEQTRLRTFGYRLGIKNSGAIAAKDVKVILELTNDGEVYACLFHNLPKIPKQYPIFNAPSGNPGKIQMYC